MSFKQWYIKTSGYVGMPVLAIMIVACTIWAAQKVFFTTTCLTASWKCEYAVGVQEAMTAIAGGEDYVIKETKRGK